MSSIKFGTDGWRAKIGEDFSFNNVRLFAQAYSNHLKNKEKFKELSIIVNFDTRFLSEEYALEAAKVFSLNGFKVIMPKRDAPLAPVSLAVVKNKCCGAVNFTAGFNKPIYNGIKLFTHKGVPPLPEETALIEKEIAEVEENYIFKPQYPEHQLIQKGDLKSDYLDYLQEIVDFDMIKQSGIKIVVDNLYGTSREYLDYVLDEHNIEIISVHNFPYSAFGGIVSSCDNDNLRDLSQLVTSQQADLGLATDVDGSRFGLVDAQGRFIDSNTIFPPLLEYLIKVRKLEGGVACCVATTENVNKVAYYYLRRVFTTKVGFKYLADILHSKKVFAAIESSNGASLNGKVKIKDGILFSLLLTEMLAYNKLEMDRILRDFYSKFPRLYSREVSIKKSKQVEKRLKELIAKKSFDYNAHNLTIKKVQLVDGVKFKFEDCWLLLRESGTNPLIRIYAESTGIKQTNNLIRLGRSLIE